MPKKFPDPQKYCQRNQFRAVAAILDANENPVLLSWQRTSFVCFTVALDGKAPSPSFAEQFLPALFLYIGHFYRKEFCRKFPDPYVFFFNNRSIDQPVRCGRQDQLNQDSTSPSTVFFPVTFDGYHTTQGLSPSEQRKACLPFFQFSSPNCFRKENIADPPYTFQPAINQSISIRSDQSTHLTPY